ncbi:MAG: hypothetical protein AB7O28_19260 [Vicinamibacterales bacterium]
MTRTTVRAFVGALALTLVASLAQAQSHTSMKFSGAKANTGTVTHSVMNGKNVLTLSADFVTPDTPDPHWQVVDSKGNVFLLQRIAIKEDKMNRSITLPGYIQDIAKVQIYCAWAEAVLGETTFGSTMRLTN